MRLFILRVGTHLKRNAVDYDNALQIALASSIYNNSETAAFDCIYRTQLNISHFVASQHRSLATCFDEYCSLAILTTQGFLYLVFSSLP